MPATADTRIERIRAARSATESGDREAFMRAIEELVHPDCEWEPLIAGVEGRSYRGTQGVLAFYDDFLGAFAVRYEDAEYRPVGDDSLLELTTMHMRGRQSDVEVRRELGVVYRFDADRMRHGRAYDSHARALKDAEALVA
jgi:hypothetical protein